MAGRGGLRFRKAAAGQRSGNRRAVRQGRALLSVFLAVLLANTGLYIILNMMTDKPTLSVLNADRLAVLFDSRIPPFTARIGLQIYSPTEPPVVWKC